LYLSRKLFVSLLKLKRSARDFNHSLKGFFAAFPTTGSVDDTSVVELHLPFMTFTTESQNAIQSCVFDYLNRIEDADSAEIAGESEMFALEVGFGRGRGFEVGATRAPNSLQTRRNVYPTIELFGFEEAIVGSIEVFPFDVEAGECQTLPGCLFVCL
jgi:hypothetical protein